MDADVVVVGASLAGLMAAFRASKQGCSVLVVDRKKEIGLPVQCGETTIAPVLRAFGFEDEKYISNRPKGVKVHSPRGRTMKIQGNSLEIVTLHRDIFEQAIAKRCKEQGTNFLLETTAIDVRDSTVCFSNNKEITGKVIVGADGIASEIGRRIGLVKNLPPSHIGSAAQYLVRGDAWDTEYLEIFLSNTIAPGGYVWLFPKEKNMANLGLGCIGGNNRNALARLDDFVSDRYKDVQIEKVSAGCLPLAPPLETAVKGNIILAGDAARQLNSLGGAGIHSAMLAGAIAGDTAADFIRTESRVLLSEYDVRWKKALYKKLQKSYLRREHAYKSEKQIERTCVFLQLLSPLLHILPLNTLKLIGGDFEQYANEQQV